MSGGGKKKRPWGQREGKRFAFETGLLCHFFSAVLTIIAFVSPYWFVSWPRVYSGFKMIGLWQVCFAGLVLEMDPIQKSYHGCWWILAPEFYKIRDWMMPAWFVYTQVAVTICMVMELFAFVMAFIIWLRTGKTQRDLDKRPRRDPFKAIHVLCGITVASAVLMTSAVLVFGILAEKDINWMPYPNFNYLSWSYGLAVVSAFFSIFASIAMITHVMILRQELREPPRDATGMTEMAQWIAKSQSASSGDITKSKDPMKSDVKIFE